MSMKHSKVYHGGIVYTLVIIMLLPLIGSLLYALSTSWMATILPQGYTFKWFSELLTSGRFYIALWHSFVVCFSSATIATCLIVPTTFLVHYAYPQYKKLMEFLVLLPFAFPTIVASIGLMQIYSGDPILLTGTPYILIGSYIGIIFPFIYRVNANAIQGMNVPELIASSHLLGSSTWKAFLLVIVPSLKKSIMIGFVLSFSFLLGEFVFANILVGTRYETIQVYLFNMRNYSGHYTSAIVITYFMITLLLAYTLNRLSRDKQS